MITINYKQENETPIEPIKWLDDYACGIKTIDDQHMGLVELINGLLIHVSGDDEKELSYFNMVIHKLLDYVKTHFETEEKILNETKFAGYEEHKREHDLFLLNVTKTVNEYKAGSKHNLSSISAFLIEWVSHHIAVIDKQYFEHVRCNG